MRVWRPFQVALATALLSFAWAKPSPDELLNSGRADEAIRALRAEIQTNSNDALAYNRLSRVYFQLEQWDTAMHMAERAVALEPHNSLYHQWLGRSAGRKAEVSNPFTAFGLARKVKAEFERSVALDGNNLSARTDLSEYYIEAPGFLGGDRNKARLQAQAVAPYDPALAAYITARVEEKQGSGHAEEDYQKAISAGGDSARYWVELAHYYKRAARPQDMEVAINRSQTAANHDGLPEYDGAFLLLDTGRNFPAAIKMLRSYLGGDNSSEDGPAFHAHYLLGRLLEKQGDHLSAAEEYRAALALASQFRPAKGALARISR